MQVEPMANKEVKHHNWNIDRRDKEMVNKLWQPQGARQSTE